MIIGALALPIWRDPAWQGGVSGIEALAILASNPPKEHIPADMAIALAREAYLRSLV
jgi:hypothetical protein